MVQIRSFQRLQVPEAVRVVETVTFLRFFRGNLVDPAVVVLVVEGLPLVAREQLIKVSQVVTE
jgi:hypothetical protein